MACLGTPGRTELSFPTICSRPICSLQTLSERDCADARRQTVRSDIDPEAVCCCSNLVRREGHCPRRIRPRTGTDRLVARELRDEPCADLCAAVIDLARVAVSNECLVLEVQRDRGGVAESCGDAGRVSVVGRLRDIVVVAVVALPRAVQRVIMGVRGFILLCALAFVCNFGSLLRVEREAVSAAYLAPRARSLAARFPANSASNLCPGRRNAQTFQGTGI